MGLPAFVFIGSGGLVEMRDVRRVTALVGGPKARQCNSPGKARNERRPGSRRENGISPVRARLKRRPRGGCRPFRAHIRLWTSTQGCARASLPLGYYILGFQPVRGTAHRSFRSFDVVASYALLLDDSLLDDDSPLLELLSPPPPPPPPAASFSTRASR